MNRSRLLSFSWCFFFFLDEVKSFRWFHSYKNKTPLQKATKFWRNITMMCDEYRVQNAKCRVSSTRILQCMYMELNWNEKSLSLFTWKTRRCTYFVSVWRMISLQLYFPAVRLSIVLLYIWIYIHIYIYVYIFECVLWMFVRARNSHLYHFLSRAQGIQLSYKQIDLTPSCPLTIWFETYLERTKGKFKHITASTTRTTSTSYRWQQEVVWRLYLAFVHV